MDRNDKRTALIVFAIALVVKGAVLWMLRDHPLLQPAGEMDSNVYLTLAREGVPPVAYFVSPFYLYFLKLSGASIDITRIVQIVLGSIAVVLQYRTAALWFDRRGALITAAISIATGVITFNEVTILQSAVDPFLVSLALYTLTVALQRGQSSLFASAGTAAGLFILNRPNALLWLVATIVLVLLQRKRAVAFFTAGALIVMAPVLIRNYVVANELVLISSHGGLNFYIGNNETANGTYQAVRGIRPTIQGQAIDSKAMAEAATGTTLDSSGVSRWFYGRAFDWITSQPLAAATLFVRKLAYCFHQSDLALNYSYAFFTYDVVSPLRILVAGAWLIVPLGFAGMISRWRDHLFLTFIAFVPLYAFSVALFFVSSRYRLPLFVALTICAAGVTQLRRSGVVAGVLAAIVALWPVGLEDGRFLEQTNLVAWSIEHRQLEEAERLLALYAPNHGEPSRLRHRAAISYLSIGDEERAIALFEKVRMDGSAQPVLRSHATDELARLYMKSGHIDDARSLIRSIDITSLSPSRALTLGRLALDTREGRRAVELLNIAVTGDPLSAPGWQYLGIALLAENRPTDAIVALKKANELKPEDIDTLLFSALAHSRTGDIESAKRLANEALRIDPSFEPAARLLSELP